MNITISLRRNSNIVQANMFVKSKIRKQEKKKKRNTVRSLDRLSNNGFDEIKISDSNENIRSG